MEMLKCSPSYLKNSRLPHAYNEHNLLGCKAAAQQKSGNVLEEHITSTFRFNKPSKNKITSRSYSYISK